MFAKLRRPARSTIFTLFSQSLGPHVNTSEQQYLDQLAYVLSHGDRRTDRTEVGTLSTFGAMMRFDLSAGQVPILTTKKVYWKLAVKEMLWFLTGATNIQSLLKENVRIWTDWPLDTYRRKTGQNITQQAFEERIVNDDAFAQEWGGIGPSYGKQWRKWIGSDGTEYDQIATVIETLRTNPSSRRMLFHAWNVGDLSQMALPPCHMVYQFHVSHGNRLNLLVFQRSCDLLLGAPFNLAGASALQLMIAQQTNFDPGELVWMGGDVHLYLNHLDQAREQISRIPRPFPHMRLLRTAKSIDDYKISDFEVLDYDPHPAIAADVAV
jgi:thymidylate synthase